MTQIWKGNDVVAVTKVQVGPCVVTQVKDNDKDGYKAVQLGYGERKEKNIAKPQKGHLAKIKNKDSKSKTNLRYLREFRIEDDTNLNTGDKIDASAFETGDIVKVTGTSKGKGFQGVVRRHGFHGQDATHGTKDQLRMPGSIGATGPAHVFKGVRMPGRMGGDKVSTANLEIMEVDKENNILYIKGAVPGARNGLIFVSGDGELKTVVEEKAIEAKDEMTGKSEEGEKVDEKKAKDDEKLAVAKAEEGKKIEDKKKDENRENTK